MQCRNCGNALQPNASFCNSCGTPVAQPGGSGAPAAGGPFGAPGGATMVAGSPPPGMPTGGETMMAGGPPLPGGSPFGAPPAGGAPPYGGGPTMVAGGAPGGPSPFGAPPAGPGYGGPPSGSGFGAPPAPGGPPSYSGMGGPQPGMAGSVPPAAPYGSAPNPYGAPPNPYGAPPNPYGGASPYGPGYSAPRGRAGGFDINALTGRLLRLVKFDTSVFREARADPTALIPGLIVAAISILIMALGGWLYHVFQGYGGPGVEFQSGKLFLRTVLIGTLVAFGLWVGWIWLSSMILTQLFKRQAPFPALLAPAGLATVPMAVGLIMLIDPVVLPFAIAAVAGALQLTQVALQESTDAPAGEVFLANFAGFLVWAVILYLLGDGDRGFAPMPWSLGLDLSDFVRISR